MPKKSPSLIRFALLVIGSSLLLAACSNTQHHIKYVADVKPLENGALLVQKCQYFIDGMNGAGESEGCEETVVTPSKKAQ